MVEPDPSASSTSADPDDDDAARLPCLTTVSPAPAMTRADIVEMFTVCDRSPPVPTMSSVRPGTSIRTACASIVSASAVSSPTDSPLVFSPRRNAAIFGVDAAPVMISDMAHDVWSDERSRRDASVANRSGHVGEVGAVGASVIG